MQQQQQQDQYGIIPKNDPTQKTIIIQDEQGRELTRVQSSTGVRDALRSFSAAQQQPLMMQPYMMPPGSAMTTPLMYQQAPIGYYPDPITGQMFYAPPSAVPMTNQYIIEETDELEARPSFYRSLSAKKVQPYPSPKLDDIAAARRLKKKQDDYIYFCSLCERPSNDTCFFCWKIFAFPTWWGATLLGIWLVLVAGLAIVVALYASNVIK